MYYTYICVYSCKYIYIYTYAHNMYIYIYIHILPAFTSMMLGCLPEQSTTHPHGQSMALATTRKRKSPVCL